MTVLNDCVNDARVLNEADALGSVGHTVKIIGHSSPLESGEKKIEIRAQVIRVRFPAFLRKLNITFPNLPKSLNRAILYSNYYLRVLGHTARFKPDFIHCHDLNTLPVGYLAKLILGTKFVYDSHELWIDQNPFVRPSPFRKRIIKLFERFLIRKAEMVITVNESIADELAENYQIARPTVVRNCKFIPGQTSPNLKDELKISKDGILAVYTGLMAGGRGLEDFVEILSDFPNLNLAVVGPSSESFKQALVARAETLKVIDRLHLIRPVQPKEVTGYIQGADFAFVPVKNSCRSYYLSLTNKFFEGVSAGLPLVTTDFPEYKTLLERYHFGAMYNPDDLGTLRHAISEIIEPDKLNYFRKNVMLAREDLNWNKEKLKLSDLYNDLLPPASEIRSEMASSPL